MAGRVVLRRRAWDDAATERAANAGLPEDQARGAAVDRPGLTDGLLLCAARVTGWHYPGHASAIVLGYEACPSPRNKEGERFRLKSEVQGPGAGYASPRTVTSLRWRPAALAS